MCSLTTGNCPDSTVSGYQFNSHYDCINAGYAVAQKTYRNLKELPDWDKPQFEEEKIVIKYGGNVLIDRNVFNKGRYDD